MKTLYLDIFSGISGDMFIGAMLDLGVDFARFERELKKIALDGYRLQASRDRRQGIAGTKLDVVLSGKKGGHDHHHAGHGSDHGRTFSEIKVLIEGSRLSDWVRQKAVAVFQRIADAEGRIHGRPAAEVHFHEVGAVDSIVDIVGACVALEMLGRPQVLAAPAVDGTGWIECAHGQFPVPAPATLAILGARGIAVSQCAEPAELITPTGAALLAEFVERFGPMQELVAETIGFGLGSRENRTRPNVLRAVLGTAATVDEETDRVAVLETNLDDINAELLGDFVGTALDAGALDVFYTPIQMKKNRPAVLLTVLCAEPDADRFSEMILRHTTAFGVRRTMAERKKLRRKLTAISTPYGEVIVKTGSLNGRVIQMAPEFESCRACAARAGVPVKEIYDSAIRNAGHDR